MGPPVPARQQVARRQSKGKGWINTLIWAYRGPPDRKPVLPRYECLETLAESEFLEADDRSIGGGPQIIPCNWLQHYENPVDPFHVLILHSSFSGTQFVEQMAVMPEVN